MDALTPIFAVAVMLARVLPVVQLMPVLSGPWVPRTVRVGIALGLAALIAPMALPPALLVEAPGLVEALLLLARELAVGLALGFVGSLVFEGARMAGGIVDRLGSLGQEGQDGPIARLYVLLSAALFFAVGGAKLWMYALGHSYAVIALDDAVVLSDGLTLARAVADIIGLAVLLAMPVIGAVLLAELMHALAARMSSILRGAAPPASARTLVLVAAVALSLGVFADEIGTAVVVTMSELPTAMEVLHVR